MRESRGDTGENYVKRELVFCFGSNSSSVLSSVDVLEKEGEHSVVVGACGAAFVQERYTADYDDNILPRQAHVLWRRDEVWKENTLFAETAVWSFPGLSAAGVSVSEELAERPSLAGLLEELELPPVETLSAQDGIVSSWEVVLDKGRVSVYVTRDVEGPLALPLGEKHELAVLTQVGGGGGGGDDDDDDDGEDQLVHGLLVSLEKGEPAVKETLFLHTPFAVSWPEGRMETKIVQTDDVPFMHPRLEWEFTGVPPGPECTPHVELLFPKEYIVDPHDLPSYATADTVNDIELPAYRVTNKTRVHSNNLQGSLQIHLRYLADEDADKDRVQLPAVQPLAFWECPLDEDTAAAVGASFYTDQGRLLYPLNDDYTTRLYGVSVLPVLPVLPVPPVSPVSPLAAEMVPGPGRSTPAARAAAPATLFFVVAASLFLWRRLVRGQT